MNKQYLTAEDVADIMQIAESTAYVIIRKMNTELKEKGFIVCSGRVPNNYFKERTGLNYE